MELHDLALYFGGGFLCIVDWIGREERKVMHGMEGSRNDPCVASIKSMISTPRSCRKQWNEATILRTLVDVSTKKIRRSGHLNKI